MLIDYWQSLRGTSLSNLADSMKPSQNIHLLGQIPWHSPRAKFGQGLELRFRAQGQETSNPSELQQEP